MKDTDKSCNIYSIADKNIKICNRLRYAAMLSVVVSLAYIAAMELIY